jgi:hypothetical protein
MSGSYGNDRAVFQCVRFKVQLFQKVPSLNARASSQTELPFMLAQPSTLAIFVLLIIVATIRFQIHA